MATYSLVPAELKIKLLEACPDFRTLACFVVSSSVARGLYQKHAHAILTAVCRNGPKDTRGLVEDTFVAEHSGRKVQGIPAIRRSEFYSPRGSDFVEKKWAIPLEHDIRQQPQALDTQPQRAMETLWSFATVEQEVDDLTAWCAAEYEARVPAADFFESEVLQTTLSKKAIHRTLWQLRLFIARMSNLDLEPPAANTNTSSRKQSRPTVEIETEWCNYFNSGLILMYDWVESFTTLADLQTLAQVFTLLDSGFGMLGRHGLRPEKGSMLQVLFVEGKEIAELRALTGRRSWQTWTRSLKHDIHVLMESRMREGECVRGVSPEAKDNLWRAWCWLRSHLAGPPRCLSPENFGCPFEEDKATYRSYLSEHGGVDEGYLERFRPLLGRPFEGSRKDPQAMREALWMREMRKPREGEESAKE